jgi:hypothetical protein
MAQEFQNVSKTQSRPPDVSRRTGLLAADNRNKRT